MDEYTHESSLHGYRLENCTTTGLDLRGTVHSRYTPRVSLYVYVYLRECIVHTRSRSLFRGFLLEEKHLCIIIRHSYVVRRSIRLFSIYLYIIYWRKDVVEIDRFIFFIGHLDS